MKDNFALENASYWSQNCESWEVQEHGIGCDSATRRLRKSCLSPIANDVAERSVRYAHDATKGALCIRASALQLSLPGASLDCVVSLGCLRCTGKLKTALTECVHVRRLEQRLVIMVYSCFTHKKWGVTPISTLKSLRAEQRRANDYRWQSAS
jgi:ubiquinone/menaquinone biosynthesis C-methylase UbiE